MRLREQSCCFTGHRPDKLPWGEDEHDPRCVRLKQCLYTTIEEAYCVRGIRHFICGMARGCDLYFAEAVLRLRTQYPDVTLEAAIPCPTQATHWSAEEQLRHDRLLAACDFETLVQTQYTRNCMQRRNCYMVDHASLLIAVHDGLPGGTRQTILYAMKQKIPVLDIPCII